MKRRQKTDKRKLKDEADNITKLIVKIRDNFTCQHCGKEVVGVNCHASHVIPVSRDGRLAYNTKNLKVLCYHCHINWWHKHPVESGKWFTNKFSKRWEYLEKEHRENQKKRTISIVWYKEVVEGLKIELKQIQEKTINDVSISDLPF